MKREDIKLGSVLIEQIGFKPVTVSRIHETKKYGPQRPIQVRFRDGHMEYYGPEALEPQEETV